MSWHETHTKELQEPEEDKALRDELRILMGIPSKGVFPGSAKPEEKTDLASLADGLQREAIRRKRMAGLAVPNTMPRQKPIWLLAAAVIPLFLAVGGLGFWGLQQKQRADEMAQKVEHQHVENQKLLAASQALKQELQAAREESLLKAKAPETPSKNRKGVELVIPAEGSRPALPETRVVKDQQSGYK